MLLLIIFWVVLATIDPVLGVLIVGIVGPVGAYLVAAHKMSGKIATTEAAQLWEESKAIRDWVCGTNRQVRPGNHPVDRRVGRGEDRDPPFEPALGQKGESEMSTEPQKRRASDKLLPKADLSDPALHTAKELRRMLRVLTALTIALYFILGGVALYTYNLGQKNKRALCTIRANAEDRAETTQQFLLRPPERDSRNQRSGPQSQHQRVPGNRSRVGRRGLFINIGEAL
jgi:hypothetical protein